MEKHSLDQIGEFGFIDHINKQFSIKNPTSILGIGDDAAIIAPPDGQQIVISKDLLIENVHFDLSYMPLQHLGYKSVAVNISDIAAMMASPAQILVGIAVSNRFSLEALETLYQGIHAGCKNYNVDLVGGDTTSSRSGLMISITAIGYAPAERIVRRSGAKTEQVICISGDLGAAYMGLQILEREKQTFLSNPTFQPQLDEHEYIVGRQLRPEARTDLVIELNQAGILPTAMIDISDGLASEILHLCKASGVGAAIFEDKLLIHDQTRLAAAEFNLSPITCAMNGGEDYELLFTLTQQDFETMRHHRDIIAIGITRPASQGVALIATNGKAYPIQAQGFKHF